MAPAIVTGPRPAPLVGHLLPFHRDRLAFLAETARLHGDAVPLRLGPYPILLLSHPDQVHGVLTAHQHAFSKSPILRKAKIVLGEGLLTSEGEDHRRHRRLMNAAFSRERLASYAETMVAAADAMTRTWEPGRPVDVHRAAVRSTVVVAGRTLLGTQLDSDVDVIERALSDVLSAYPLALLPFADQLLRLPLPQSRRLRRGAAAFDELVGRVIAEHRAADAANGVIPTLLAGAEDGALTADEVRDEVATLLLAGHETTANTLAFACHLLAHHPEVQERLAAEVEPVCAEALPGFADVERLPLARAVMAEALRLYPPSWTMGRQAVRDVDVDGLGVPSGTVVFVSQWVVHRDPRWWDDPGAFVPERWLDAARPRRGTYFPFGAGSRQCIGEAFAWTEGILGLAMIASRWRLTPPEPPRPAEELELEPLITLRPAAGVWVVPTPGR